MDKSQHAVLVTQTTNDDGGSGGGAGGSVFLDADLIRYAYY